MRTSSGGIVNVATALIKAQAAFKPAAKTATNPHFRSKYATLTDVWDAVREALAEHGLGVVQSPEPVQRGIAVCTTILHTSGEYLETYTFVPLGPEANAQNAIAAASYGRRCGLAAALGVVNDEDDDGAGAVAKPASAPWPARKG